MRPIAHFADVLAQKRARKGRLAYVGMRQEADIDLVRPAHARSPAVHSAARASSRALISEAAPGLIWMRSAKLARKPYPATNSRHNLRRSWTRCSKPAS